MLKTKVSPVYAERRKKIMAQDKTSCFIFYGATEVARNNYHTYPFRQNSSFYYLTEFTEPGAILVLVGGKSILFSQERVPERELWDGDIYGAERAKNIFHFDEAFMVSEFEVKLDEYLATSAQVYFQLGLNEKHDQKILKIVYAARKHQGSGSHAQLSIVDPTSLLAKMRMVKDAYEIEQMRKAAQASVKSHIQLMKHVRAGMNEAELFAEFQYTALKKGGHDLGYTPIVAGGKNATTLHYVHNNDTLKAGEMVLVDAGAEHNYYTADVTNTFPVSAKFSPDQKLIYQAVLDVNRAVTAMMKPGVTYKELNTRSIELLTKSLIDLNVLTGTLEENISNKTYRAYYPHGVGHHLGLDVHDASLYEENKKDFELKAGMVLTVEPGLYFRDECSRFYGIGVRIEDDVLITDSGHEVLTADLPRDIEAIEALRAGT